MRNKFVGWALAHRDSMVGQSSTLLRKQGSRSAEALMYSRFRGNDIKGMKQYAEFVKRI
jgi:hypothetical protein